jgi:hypothetical protein
VAEVEPAAIEDVAQLRLMELGGFQSGAVIREVLVVGASVDERLEVWRSRDARCHVRLPGSRMQPAGVVSKINSLADAIADQSGEPLDS